MGGLWGPLLFPVLAAGLLASHKWAGSRLGISSPPAGLALAGQSSRFCERGQCGGLPAPPSAAPASASACPAQVCPGFPGGAPDPGPPTSPSCRPHVLPPSVLEAVFLSPEPLRPDCRTHRTEDKAGQEAVYWLLISSSGTVLEVSLGLVLRFRLRFRLRLGLVLSSPKDSEDRSWDVGVEAHTLLLESWIHHQCLHHLNHRSLLAPC